MQAIVKKAFRHLSTGNVYGEGALFEGPPETVDELVERGYLEAAPASEEVREEPEAQEGAGAPDLEAMTVKELRALCEGMGLDVPFKARKADLVEMASCRGGE